VYVPRKFSARLEDIFSESGGYFWGGGVIFIEKISPWEKSVGKILHGVIFRESNFPLGIEDFQGKFFTEGGGDFQRDLSNNQRLKSLFQIKVC